MNRLTQLPTELVEKILSELPDLDINYTLEVYPELKDRIQRVVLKNLYTPKEVENYYRHFLETPIPKTEYYTTDSPTDYFILSYLIIDGNLLPPGYNPKKIKKILKSKYLIYNQEYTPYTEEFSQYNVSEPLDPQIQNLISLEQIFINEGSLQILPRWIGQLTNLYKLAILNTQLRSIPSEIGNLTQLENLSLHTNQLTEFPESIVNLTQLKILRLSDNRLTRLPESIGKLQKLEVLTLENNNLTRLPESLKNLKNLTNLELGDNPLISDWNFLSHLSNLTTLDLKNLNLNSLPESIWELNSLKYLNISGNQLNELSPKINNLRKLESFHCSNNLLTNLDLDLPNLEFLYADNNQLTEFPRLVTPKLQDLILTHNQIEELPDPFPDFPELYIFSLGHNRLTELNLEIFNDPYIVFDASFNQLTSVNLLVQTVREIYLNDNQIENVEIRIKDIGDQSFINLNNNLIEDLPDIAYSIPTFLIGNPVEDTDEETVIVTEDQLAQFIANNDITITFEEFMENY